MPPKRKASLKVTEAIKRAKGPTRSPSSSTSSTAPPPNDSLEVRLKSMESQLDRLTSLLEKAVDKTNEQPEVSSPDSGAEPSATGLDPGVVSVVEHIAGKHSPPPVVHSAVPLAAGVSSKLKDSIWANEFIDLRDLLSPLDKKTYTMTMDNIEGTPQVVWRPVAKKFKMSFTQWSTAWNKFLAIYTDHPDHSREAPLLAKHFDVVSKISRYNGDWATYDEGFRTLLSEGSVSWGQVHQELYSDARFNIMTPTQNCNFNRGGNTQQSRRPASNSGGQTPAGACFKHHRGLLCPHGLDCKFQHACYNCGGPHPYSQCQSPANPPFRIQQRFRTQGANNKPFPPRSGSETAGPSPNATTSQPGKRPYTSVSANTANSNKTG
jgi:hypothetical protein